MPWELSLDDHEVCINKFTDQYQDQEHGSVDKALAVHVKTQIQIQEHMKAG